MTNGHITSIQFRIAGPCIAVGRAPDSKVRGPGFDTWSGHILSFLLPLIPEGQLSVTGESMCTKYWPGRVTQLVGHLTRKSGVLGSISCLATYFRFSLRFFKKGSCQLLVKVCARSTALRRSKPAQEKCG